MAVGSSVGAALLSTNWVVEKSHSGAYSGGTVAVSSDGSLIACLCGGDVCFVDVELGKKRWTLRGHRALNSSRKAGYDEAIHRREAIEEEEEEVVCFSLPHKKIRLKKTERDAKDGENDGEMEIMVATRNLLLRRWILRDEGFVVANTIKAHDQVVLSMEYDRYYMHELDSLACITCKNDYIHLVLAYDGFCYGSPTQSPANAAVLAHCGCSWI